MGGSDRQGFFKAFGPGVLFTGAAVGVSHLVQSTRAGAGWGFALVLFVVLANVAKYPAFRFGPQYAAATGTSLLEAYRRQGRWTLWVYATLTVLTMFAVQAAVTMVTAALAKALFQIDISIVLVSGVLIALCAGLIAAGRYHWLDKISKVVVAVLTVSTVVATALVLPRIDWTRIELVPSTLDRATILFLAGLVGWMPSAIDVAVWQSLWTLARRQDTGHRPTVRQSLLDFNIGYWATAVLALCFLTLGAGVMHGRGVTFAEGGAAFAAQVIALYTETLGQWAGPLIATAAFATMFSTTLTVVDGFPRALAVLVSRFRGAEEPHGEDSDPRHERGVYWTSLVVIAVGSLVIIGLLLASLKTMVDLATTLSFLTAPVLAWFNHRAILSAEVPPDLRPGPALRAASWGGIVFLGGFALYYLYLRFLG